jgi:hypothetical protein
VRIEFEDQTYIIGFAKENQLTGILRHFSENNELLNVTTAASGLTLFFSLMEGTFLKGLPSP